MELNRIITVELGRLGDGANDGRLESTKRSRRNEVGSIEVETLFGCPRGNRRMNMVNWGLPCDWGKVD